MGETLTEKRRPLDTVLREIVRSRCGSETVYYQPPNGLHMNYPCICYERSKIRNRAADNIAYLQHFLYLVTVIDTDPDSEMVAAVAALPRCAHDRHFISEGLHHDTFTIEY